MNQIGGRKFLTTFLVIALGATVDVFAPNGLSMNLAGLLGTALMVYAGANVWNKVKAKAPVANSDSNAIFMKEITQTMAGFQEAQTALANTQKAMNNRLVAMMAKAGLQ